MSQLLARGCAGLCFILTFSSSTSAQPASTAHVIGSTTAGYRVASNVFDHQELDVKPGLRLIERKTSEIDTARLSRFPKDTIGPMRQAGGDIRQLDVYFDRVLIPEDLRGLSTANSTLKLIVKATSVKGVVRWWEMQSRPGQPDEVPIDLLEIEDEPSGAEAARPASDDPSLAIVQVTYQSSYRGANSGGVMKRDVLIDFRERAPAVLAVLSTQTHEGGGACTAYDSIYEVRTEVGCRWDPARRDFVCGETAHRFDTKWGSRRGSRFFELKSGARIPLAHAADPANLEALASRAPGGIESRGPFTLDRYGDATAIAGLGRPDRQIVLIGAPTLSMWFDARFFVGVLDPGRPVHVQEITTRSIEGADQSNFDPLHPDKASIYTPDGLVPRFDTRALVTGERVTILEVTVSEGDARGVYLVGMERQDDGGIRADALLVATDGQTYDQCDRWILPATAVSMTVRTEPAFVATLEVEPANLESQDGELTRKSGQVDCRSELEVSWRTGTGFSLQSRPRTCERPETPRRVKIEADGQIRPDP